MEQKSPHSFPHAPTSNTAQARPALGRVLGIARVLQGLAGTVSIVVVLTELIMPTPLKPSAIIGTFHGRIEKFDTETKVDAIEEFNRRMALATAKAQATLNMEVDNFQRQGRTIEDTLQVQTAWANIADFACIAGKMIPRGGESQPFGEALRSACGEGDRVRASEVETYKRAGQAGSTLVQRPVPESPAGPARQIPMYRPVQP